MSIKAPTQDQITTALGDSAKAAMAGMAGGPIGAAVGGLMALASDLVPAVFGPDTIPALASAAAAITSQSTEAAQVAVLTKDPAATEAFRLQALQIAADQQKQRDAISLQIQQMLMDQQKADQADTANARQMGVQYAQANSKMQWAQPIVSVLIVVGFFVALVGMLLYRSNIDPVVGTIINVLVGVLASNFTQVCNFWLGSSSGSAEKTRLLASSIPASMMPSPAAVVPAADVPNPNS